jgi:hypothetical protein
MTREVRPPCHIYGLLARDAPAGVLLRRGPTDWVQLVLWHVDSDTLEAGQWLHAGVYEGHSDLSPNGRLFLYHARKPETPERRQSSYTHAWTAISKPPYFTALALWPAGDGWDGGGYFVDDHTVWLCHASAHAHPKHRPRGLQVQNSREPERSLERSVRDGWDLVQRGQFSFERDAESRTTRGIPAIGTTEQPYIWQKYGPDRRYRLVTELYREPDFQVATLTYVADEAGGPPIPIEDVAWVDWDQRGRLVFARAGQLLVATQISPALEARVIADLNESRPARLAAPAWTMRW